jgi:hypothetical protein
MRWHQPFDLTQKVNDILNTFLVKKDRKQFDAPHIHGELLKLGASRHLWRTSVAEFLVVET